MKNRCADHTSSSVSHLPSASNPSPEQPSGADRAGGQTTGLKIGDPAPTFNAIIGIDDKRHDLDEYRDAKLVVLVFTCNHCPVAQDYEDRLMAIAKDYQGKGVQLVAVNVNNIPADRLDEMKNHAKDKGFSFPYLYDPSQKIGHDYGAKCTPHVFVLDNQRKIAYMGAIDDAQIRREGESALPSRRPRRALDGPEAARGADATSGLRHQVRMTAN